ncbi:class I adenylate-forming enzyme family protein [Haloechinothrix halophila]|uniref:class I adenylate-forming enzyme family protein n=1 Tax=Haloechinothrix halophila TaxID=1069073 RepID=UPI00042A9068|nr:AMP-binding protein [Haloechinothrix halophila]
MSTAATSVHLGALSEESLDRNGDHESLIFEGRSWHSAELLDRARSVAGGLREIGVEPGDRVVVMMANCPEVPVVYNAIWRMGAVVTPVVFLLTAPELRHVLIDSGAKAVVTTGDFVPKVVEAASELGTKPHIVVAEANGAEQQDGFDVTTFDALESAEAIAVVDRDEDDLAALMYTGGTTGRSKGVELSHRNLWHCGRSAHDASYVPGLTRVLNPLPISHAFGMIVTVSGMHAPEPGIAVLMRWFDPGQWVSLAEQNRIERGTLVPAMAQLLLTQQLENADLSSLRYLNIGAAPLARETIDTLEQRIPSVQVLEGYGCTESGGVVSANPPGRRKIGSVGPPIPGYEVRIVDEDGQQVPTGSDGEVTVRAEGIMRGYRNAPDATEAALRDGWLFTGDIGRLDDDGFLTIVDRKKDLIIRNGFNVYPRDVEDVLVEHPAVAMAGVVGQRNDAVGEEVVAFVSLAPGAEATEEELIAFAKTKLAGSKYPRIIHIQDQLPLTSVGKLDRKALRGHV